MGEYIKKLRTDSGLSQEELGKIVGVNRAAVNKWENGSVENIKRSVIKQLSIFFDVSPCDLMCWDNDPELLNLNSAKDKFDDNGLKTLLDNYSSLNDEGREKLLDYSDDLVSSGKYIKNNEFLALEKA